VLISLSSLDFSYIVENIEIFKLLHLYKMKVDVIQIHRDKLFQCVLKILMMLSDYFEKHLKKQRI
jgi:aspartate kinase